MTVWLSKITVALCMTVLAFPGFQLNASNRVDSTISELSDSLIIRRGIEFKPNRSLPITVFGPTDDSPYWSQSSVRDGIGYHMWCFSALLKSRDHECLVLLGAIPQAAETESAGKTIPNPFTFRELSLIFGKTAQEADNAAELLVFPSKPARYEVVCYYKVPEGLTKFCTAFPDEDLERKLGYGKNAYQTRLETDMPHLYRLFFQKEGFPPCSMLIMLTDKGERHLKHYLAMLYKTFR